MRAAKRLSSWLPLYCACTIPGAGAPAAPHRQTPANDAGAAANSLTSTSGQRAGNPCDATNDGPSSCRPAPLNRDVWFRYTDTVA